MVLSDFFSRQSNDDSNPYELIPILFNLYQVLHEIYYNTENYLVQTRFQVRSSGIKLPVVHGVEKNLDPNIEPEKQHASPIKGSIEKPCTGQGRAGSRRKRPEPINQTIIPPSELSQKIPGQTKIETRKTNCVNSTDPIHSINNANEGMPHNNTFNPRCSLPSKSNCQAPSQSYYIQHAQKSGKFTKFIQFRY